MDNNYYSIKKTKADFCNCWFRIVQIKTILYSDIENKLKEFVNECNAEQTNIV